MPIAPVTPPHTQDRIANNEHLKVFELLRHLSSNPFINGVLVETEPTNDTGAPSRTSSEPASPQLLKVPANSSRDIPHGLGRKHSRVMLFAERRPGGTGASGALYEDRDAVSSALENTHVRIRNTTSDNVFFAMWVS